MLPRTLCRYRPGEIVVFDKAYIDFAHLFDLLQRGVFWVTRAKDNMAAEVLHSLPVTGRILRDELIALSNAPALADYPELLRRITALVEVDGVEQEMVFLTNNMEWSPASVSDLYRCRWSIEAFFKQIKQTLQLADFLGHSANAVRWQIWTALLVYVLLRFLAFAHGWHHSFTRIFTLIRSAMWRRWDLSSLLQSYGTASGDFRFIATPQQPCFKGF
jgi:Transposase DDE domain